MDRSGKAPPQRLKTTDIEEEGGCRRGERRRVSLTIGFAVVEVRLRVKLERLIVPNIVRPIAPPRYSETIARELAMAVSAILMNGISIDMYRIR